METVVTENVRREVKVVDVNIESPVKRRHQRSAWERGHAAIAQTVPAPTCAGLGGH